MNLLNLTIPIFVETLLFMLLGFMDTFALSQISDLQSAAAGASNQIVSVFNIVFSIISGATTILISQNLGAKKRENASKIAGVSIFMNLIMGIICSFILVTFSTPLLKSVGLKGETLSYSKEYLIIVGGFLFLQAVLNTFTAILRSHGYTKFSMYVTMIMNITNGVLDFILVLGLFGMPRLGVKGVAIATSFSRIIGVIIIGIFIFTKIEKISVFKYLHPFPKNIFKNLLKIGVPSAMESMSYQIYQILVTTMILKYMGELDFAAKIYTQNIIMFVFIFSVALGQATQILVGHMVGAKKIKKAKETCLKSLKISLIISFSLSILVFIFRRNIITLFTQDKYIIDLISKVLAIDILVEVGRTFNIVVISGLKGAGDTVFPVVMALIFMWGVGALGSFIFGVVLGKGLVGMWIAFALDECIRGIIMLIRWKGEKWKSKALVC